MQTSLSCTVRKGAFGWHAVSLQEPGVWSYSKSSDADAACRLFVKVLLREKHPWLVVVSQLRGNELTPREDGTWSLKMVDAPFRLKQDRKLGNAGVLGVKDKSKPTKKEPWRKPKVREV
jgi:hypothetical protein